MIKALPQFYMFPNYVVSNVQSQMGVSVIESSQPSYTVPLLPEWPTGCYPLAKQVILM